MLVLLILIILLIFVLLILFRIKDRSYLKKSVKDVLSHRVQEDINKDKEDFIRRQSKFEKYLEK